MNIRDKLSLISCQIQELNYLCSGNCWKYKIQNIYSQIFFKNDCKNYYLKDIIILGLELIKFNLEKKRRLKEIFEEYYSEDFELFEGYRIELYNLSSKLFNFYQDCFVRKTAEGNRKMFIKDVEFEFRPLVIDLHNIFKSDRQKTDKRKVNYYVNNLPSARILFTMNYKNYKNNKPNQKNNAS